MHRTGEAIPGKKRNKVKFILVFAVPIFFLGIVYSVTIFIQSSAAGSFGSPILNTSCYSALENKKQTYIPQTITLKSKVADSKEISAEKINSLLSESLNYCATQNKKNQDSKNNEKAQEEKAEPAGDQSINTNQESQNLSYIENSLLQLTNNIRAQNGLPPLSISQSLSNIAYLRNMDMHNRDYFSHHTPEGKNVFSILRENGIAFSYGGENLYKCTPASDGSPGAVMGSWLSINVHRANIVSPHHRQVGISVMDRGGKRIVTAIFTN